MNIVFNPLINETRIGDYTCKNNFYIGQYINDYMKFELKDEYRDNKAIFKITNIIFRMR